LATPQYYFRIAQKN